MLHFTGTLANDALRRIHNMNPGNLDTAIEIHEELCDIVTATVTAFCPWFVGHWFLYGVTCSLAIVYISEVISSHGHVVSVLYIAFFIVTHLYLFLFPCFCAAYITSSCGGELLQRLGRQLTSRRTRYKTTDLITKYNHFT